MSQDNMVSINNALSAAITGQIATETIGTRSMASPGGQIDFTIGVQSSRAGRALTVTPPRSRDGKISRIVQAIPASMTVTMPRTYADYIVTEYGMARLRGKSLTEGIGEIIAMAHPDFRYELKKEAQRLDEVWM